MNIMNFLLLVIDTFSNIWSWLSTDISIAGYNVAPLTLVFSSLIFVGVLRAVI